MENAKRIDSVTIRMILPRIASAPSERNDRLIEQEGLLRAAAYRNTTIRADNTFFDDSDMHVPYHLIVVFDQETQVALLSARYYDLQAPLNISVNGNPAIFSARNTFLVDRMSANVASPVYRQFRNRAHVLFYMELLRHNRNRTILAMARREKGDKLLNKYLGMGLEVIGTTMHYRKEHWVLTGSVEHYFAQTPNRQILDGLASPENISTE